MAIAGLKNLCAPSKLYLVISLIALVIMSFQNYGNANIYCIGSYSCDVSSTTLIFVLQFIYIVFWTWILNLICRAGAPTISWVLVLLPFLLFFILLALMMF